MQVFILDTNVLLQDCNIFYKFLNKGDVLISSIVVKELDTFKTRYDTIGKNARAHMRFLDDLIQNSEERLVDGICVEGCENKLFSFSMDLNKDSIADDEIFDFCKENSSDPLMDITVVTNDINLKLRLNSDKNIKVKTLSYIEDYFESDYKIYSGYKEVVVGQGVINSIYDTTQEITVNDIFDLEEELHPNQFINFKAGHDLKSSVLVRYSDRDVPLKPIKSKFAEVEKYAIYPRNREQIFALNLLLDPSINIVTLIGPAGSGKTLLALSCGLVQSDVFMKKNKKKETDSVYKKIVISRPIQPMGRDIGFLPGSMQEKMGPWVQPIVDNLEFLFGGDSMMVGDIMETGLIQVEAPTFIRGRTISNAYIIIDEVQNLSRHELKTILTRVGENSKIILTGDIQQIDNKDVDETTNGLTYIVEKFKKYEISGHVTLFKGERSELATLAAEIL